MSTALGKIDCYHLKKILGRGAMGTVYLGEHDQLGKLVAVKVLSHANADSSIRVRFFREAKTLSQLHHKNVIKVFDCGESEDKTPFIIMEYIDGITLETMERNSHALPLNLAEKLNIIIQLLEGLAHAHEHGIVHRDIKPANIMITNGKAILLDFGIAHLQDSTMTSMGTVLGTVNYMSPEQISGYETNHLTDIFTVGVLAYELIAESHPFRADHIGDTAVRIVNFDPGYP